MSRNSTKATVFLCNIIITILCAISIASYFFLPFWKMDLALNLDAETIESVIPLDELQTEDISFENVDLKEILGEEGIHISLSITLETKQVLSATTKDASQTVQAILNENVDKLVEQLHDPLQNLANAVVRVAAKTTLKDVLHSQTADIYGDEKTAEEVQQFLTDAGIDDAYIDEKADQLFDSLHAENANVDSVSDTVVDIVEESLAKMETADPDQNFTMSEEDKQAVKDTVKEVLNEIAAEDGSINMDDLIAELLLKTLSQEKAPNEEGEAFTTLSATPEQNEQTNESTLEELQATLREKLTSAIDEEVVHAIAGALKIIGYVIYFTFFTWAFVILKILLKMGAKNNAVRVGLPIVFGSIPFWVFYLLPTLLINAIKAPPIFLVGLLGGADAAANITKAMSIFSLTFSSWIVNVQVL